MGNSCSSTLKKKNLSKIKANKIKNNQDKITNEISENSQTKKFKNNLVIENKNFTFENTKKIQNPISNNSRSRSFTLERNISHQIQIPISNNPENNNITIKSNFSDKIQNEISNNSEGQNFSYERKSSDQIQIPSLYMSESQSFTYVRNFSDQIKIPSLNINNLNINTDFDASANSPNFQPYNFSFRDPVSSNHSDFAIKFLEEVNKSRTNFSEISLKLEKYLINFDAFENDLKKLKIFNTKYKKYFLRTKDDFITAIDFFKDLQERNIKLKPLEIKDDLLFEFQGNCRGFDKEWVDETLKMIKKKLRHDCKMSFIDCHLNHIDPEISFILLIINRIKRNKCEHLFSESSKYIGINSKRNCDESNLICIILAG